MEPAKAHRSFGDLEEVEERRRSVWDARVVAAADIAGLVFAVGRGCVSRCLRHHGAGKPARYIYRALSLAVTTWQERRAT